MWSRKPRSRRKAYKRRWGSIALALASVKLQAVNIEADLLISWCFWGLV